MAKKAIKILKVTDVEDPEVTTYLLSKEDAELVLGENLIHRVTAEDREMRQKLSRMCKHEGILRDFIETNAELLLFEVYPAELLGVVQAPVEITIEVND